MNDPKTRLYGMSDPSNNDAPAINGMRGEAAGDVDGAGYQRTVMLDDQPPIEVEEVSGVASAEVNRVIPSVPEPIAVVPQMPAVPQSVSVPTPLAASPPPPLSPWPWIVVSLVAGFLIGKRRGDRTDVVVVAVPPTAAEGVRRDLDQVLI